jgi:ACS family hexuronate transporter-like MFS transporter
MLNTSPVRWAIAGLLFLAAILNYIDRNVLGLLAPTIQKDLGMTDAQYATVVDLFLVAYTAAYLLSGRMVDRLGTRLSLALFIGWWSAANALTALARSVASMGLFRFLLGLGEAGGFTASPKVVAEWFPPRERALAVGLYSAGSSVGATVAPLLVIALAERYGWQGAFVATGVIGLLWLIPWLCIVPRPAASTPASAAPTAPAGSEWALWREVVRQPVVWRLMGARFLTDAVWYFYLFWMPKYLHTARGVDQSDLSILWRIFLAADIGFLAGGYLSGRLIRRGVPAPASRLWLMLASAVLVPLSPLVPLAPTVGMSLAVAMMIALAHTSWLSNLTALAVDLVPPRILATSFGLIAGGSAAGGILMNELVAGAIAHCSYDLCFTAMAFAHPVALLLAWPLRHATPPPQDRTPAGDVTT